MIISWLFPTKSVGENMITFNSALSYSPVYQAGDLSDAGERVWDMVRESETEHRHPSSDDIRWLSHGNLF